MEELQRKYRPTTLEEFYGQSSLKKTLTAYIEKNKLPQSILMEGPRGTGKTTLSRILAYNMGSGDFDITEIDTADFSGVETSRDIRRKMHTKPLQGSKRVWILDECHRMSGNAMDGLLKALEEPPAHVQFFLCTTEPNSLTKTLISRCTRFNLKPVTDKVMINLIRDVTKKEGVEIPTKVMKYVVEASEGIPREALKMLSDVAVQDNEEDMMKAITQADAEVAVKELCTALKDKKSFDDVKPIIARLNADVENDRRAILGYFNKLLIGNKTKIGAIVIEEFLQPFFYTGRPGFNHAVYRVCKKFNK